MRNHPSDDVSTGPVVLPEAYFISDRSSARARLRYAAFVAVLLVHLALIVTLVVSSNTRRFLHEVAPPIELLVLPPSEGSKNTPATTARRRISGIPAVPSPARELTLAPTINAQEESSRTGGIDWQSEAEHVAKEMATSTVDTHRSPVSLPSRQPKSVFPARPAHQAGEAMTMATGERGVYVNEDCYQLERSTPSNASNTGMVNPTYCIGRSESPRGDLFEELAAYKKFHPN